jgi:capsular exopolysaccharide synthesis family protein
MPRTAASRLRKLHTYLMVVRRWLWLWALCATLGAITAFAISKSQPSVYRATTLLIVEEQAPGGDAYSNELASNQLVSTYLTLINQPTVLRMAADQVGGISATELAKRTRISNPGTSTQIIEIQVDDEHPTRAAHLANAIATAFILVQQQAEDARYGAAQQQVTQQLTDVSNQIVSLNNQISAFKATDHTNPEYLALSSQLTVAMAQRDSLQSLSSQLTAQHLTVGNSIRVFEQANAPTTPDHPVPLFNAAVAGFAGLLLAIGVALTFELLDDRIRTVEQAQATTDLSLIASVATHPHNRLLLTSAKGSRLKESFEVLRSSLSFMSIEKPLHVIAVTSALPGEGKTTVAVNLAISLAQCGKRVLLVDGNLRDPKAHRLLGVSNEDGLSQYLVPDSEFTTLEATSNSSVPNLRVLTAGPETANSTELLGSRRLGDLLTTALADSQTDSGLDAVVLDTPPVMKSPDAILLTSHADGTILVVDRMVSHEESVVEARDELNRAHVKIVGIVFNHAPAGQDSRYQYRDQERRTAHLAEQKNAALAERPTLPALPQPHARRQDVPR